MTRNGFRLLDPRRRLWLAAGVSVSAATLVMVGGLVVMSGCNTRTEQLRPENLFSRIGHQNGEVIEPRKCMLRVAILDRALRDPVLNDVVWKVADEQAIPFETRRTLESNGLKMGLISGELPPELEAVLDSPPPHKVDPATFLVYDGDPTQIVTSETVEQATLLVNRDGRPSGSDFRQASGYFRVTATHDGTNRIALRFTPEIHHGPVQRSFQPIAETGPYSPQQFKINDGQKVETFGDLSATLTLEVGQVAVVGCRPEQKRSLGSFLLTQGEATAEQRRQKLIMVWAGRNQLGAIGERPAKTDQPQPSARALTGADTKSATDVEKQAPPAAVARKEAAPAPGSRSAGSR